MRRLSFNDPQSPDGGLVMTQQDPRNQRLAPLSVNLKDIKISVTFLSAKPQLNLNSVIRSPSHSRIMIYTRYSMESVIQMFEDKTNELSSRVRKFSTLATDLCSMPMP